MGLHCEGGRLSFPDAEAREWFIDRFCAAIPGWESCQIANYVHEAYERRIPNDGT